jgi:hypothetical protein
VSKANQLLLTIVRLRPYPAYPVRGSPFGLDRMPLADPGPRHRRDLQQFLKNTPGLMLLVDTLERRAQRPAEPAEQQEWYSGKKKCHTIKAESLWRSRRGGSSTWPIACQDRPPTSPAAGPKSSIGSAAGDADTLAVGLVKRQNAA